MSGYGEPRHETGAERAMRRNAEEAAARGLRLALKGQAKSYAPGRAVMLMPEVHVGGAERAMIAVMKQTKYLFHWRGFAILTQVTDKALQAEMESIAPVVFGSRDCRDMIAGCDVLVSWVIRDLPTYLPQEGRKPFVVAMSHSTVDSPWAVQMMGDHAGIDRFVAISSSAIGPVPDERKKDAVVIPNTIDFSRFSSTKTPAEMRSEWGLPPHAKILGGLHRIAIEKYPEGLVHAVAELPPEWYGVICGEGFHRIKLQALINEVAPGRVILPGARLDAGNVLRAFDSHLCASDYESFCLTMAEGVICQAPTIATPVGVALDHPKMFRPIPIRASGSEIAQAVLADQADVQGTQERVLWAFHMAKDVWHPDSVANAWADLVRPHMRPSAMIEHHAVEAKPPKVDRKAMLEKAKGCPDRKKQSGCNCFFCDKLQQKVSMSVCLECEYVTG